MKKYIQPASEVVNFYAEGAIMAASKLGIHQEAATEDALSNKKTDMWGRQDMWK